MKKTDKTNDQAGRKPCREYNDQAGRKPCREYNEQKIVWALDPFEDKNETRVHVISTLRDLASRGATIDPVYVLSPDEYDLNIEFNTPWLKKIRPTTQTLLERYIKNIRIPGLGKPQVLVERRPSLTRAVQALVAYAKRVNADTIIVGTHGRHGLSRFFLGSFSETLLLQSSIPVLVVGPHSAHPHADHHAQSKTERILFSTDFGPASLPAFRKVIALAKAHHAKITLFHRLPHAVEPMVQSGVYLLGGGVVSFPDFATQDERRKLKLAQRYVNEAQKHGVEVLIGFDNGRANTAKAIVAHAQSEKSDLIAMAAQSGPVAAALVGSVTRQVVRSAPCPVWVLRAS